MYENPLPTTRFTLINHPDLVKIQIERRRVQLVDSVMPAADNAWVYVKVPHARPPGTGVRRSYLGPIVNVQRGSPCRFRWINALPAMMGMPQMQEAPPISPKPMDPAMPMQPSVGVVTHLHGAKLAPDSDGWPLHPVSYAGNPYGFPTERRYTYPNDQRAAMLWFHDHAMDNTGPQVYAGLAGLYFIRDGSDTDIFDLIGGAQQEIPLVIQDRMLDCGDQRVSYSAGLPNDPGNPNLAPDGYGRPEFLGDTVFVNGRATPFLDAERAIYRLRILNGSNARTYALALLDPFWWQREGNSRLWYGDRLRVIGNDGGLFTRSVLLDATGYLLIAPGERLDVLLDLTDPALADVSCLRLVNLAVKSALTDPGPEGIFQTDAISVLAGADPNNPNPPPGPINDSDTSLINALKLGPANIMQFCLGRPAAAPILDIAALDAVLSGHAADGGFDLNGSVLGPCPAGAAVVRNRLVLLMNNTTGASGSNPLTEWKDTQMWELGPPDSAAGIPGWQLPFLVDTAGPNPAPGDAGPQTGYGIYRASFFQQDPAPSIDMLGSYPPVHAPSYTPQAGSYERWYVANVGNMQPLVDAAPDGTVPDMHPFHMHLVNFTVLRRWTLDSSGLFVLQATPRASDFDGISRHDTVRIQANELLELLVYFPAGYTGDYVYHCHLVEHEDMGMMLHFSVI